MNRILERLRGTDRRSIGNSQQVVAEVLARPGSFPSLFEGLLNDDPVIRMRAADAVEKITVHHPELLRKVKTKLINAVSRIGQQEVRWHVAQMFPRLHLTPEERRVVYNILLEYLNDTSKIVKTCSMEALADIAEHDESLRRPIIRRLERLTRTGSPAMKSRGKKLLLRLASDSAMHRRRGLRTGR